MKLIYTKMEAHLVVNVLVVMLVLYKVKVVPFAVDHNLLVRLVI